MLTSLTYRLLLIGSVPFQAAEHPLPSMKASVQNLLPVELARPLTEVLFQVSTYGAEKRAGKLPVVPPGVTVRVGVAVAGPELL